MSADELFQQQTEANKLLQDDQDKAASESLFQLQVQSDALAAAHQDRLRQIDGENTAMSRAFEDESNRIAIQDAMRQESHQLQTDLWQDEDTQRQNAYADESFNIEGVRLARQRQSEDEQFAIEGERLQSQRKYEDAAKAIDDEISAQQSLLGEEKDRLQAAQDALSLWQQVDGLVGSSAQGLVNALTTVSGGNIPAKASGGYVSGMAIVGDSPSGDLTNAEVVIGNFQVLSHTESVRRGLIPGNGISRYVSGTSGTSGGDQYNLTFVASGNTSSDEAMFQRLTAWVAQRDRASEINRRRTALGARSASEGNARY